MGLQDASLGEKDQRLDLGTVQLDVRDQAVKDHSDHIRVVRFPRERCAFGVNAQDHAGKLWTIVKPKHLEHDPGRQGRKADLGPGLPSVLPGSNDLERHVFRRVEMREQSGRERCSELVPGSLEQVAGSGRVLNEGMNEMSLHQDLPAWERRGRAGVQNEGNLREVVFLHDGVVQHRLDSLGSNAWQAVDQMSEDDVAVVMEPPGDLQGAVEQAIGVDLVGMGEPVGRQRFLEKNAKLQDVLGRQIENGEERCGRVARMICRFPRTRWASLSVRIR